jgi:hypothetical protein
LPVLGAIALILLGLGVRAWLAVSDPVPVSLGFQSHNGEVGSLPAEVIVNHEPARTVTTTCVSKDAKQPSDCRVELELLPGRYTFSVRVATPQGWTPWSEPATEEVKPR